jgi:hypothetical protein
MQVESRQITAEEAKFLTQFNQTTQPKVSSTLIRVAFTIFNFTKHDVSMSGGGLANISINNRAVSYRDPGFDGSVYGDGSSETKELSLFIFEPTHVVVLPAADDSSQDSKIRLCYQYVDGSYSKQTDLTFSKKYNCFFIGPDTFPPQYTRPAKFEPKQ